MRRTSVYIYQKLRGVLNSIDDHYLQAKSYAKCTIEGQGSRLYKTQ